MTYRSIADQNLERQVAKIEQELVQLKTKQNYLITDVATFKNGPLRLTAWATPDYMVNVWGGWYSVSVLMNFDGILPNKTCFGYADFVAYGGSNHRIYTSYVWGNGAKNKMQMLTQVVGKGQFDCDLYFWSNSPGTLTLVEQFVFETDEW